jgi:hypothetical protein
MRPRAIAATGGAVIVLLAASPAGAVQARTSSASDTKGWCALVIRLNTQLGIMKNKRYIPVRSLSLSTWRKVVDAAVANGDRLIALAPSSIKTAEKHQIAYFKRVKANHYVRTTPLAPLTLAENGQLTTFQKTKCGITFSG